jgi:hypothetical protein
VPTLEADQMVGVRKGDQSLAEKRQVGDSRGSMDTSSAMKPGKG